MQTETFTGIMLPPEALLADDNIRFSLKASRIESLAQDILERGEVIVPLEVETLDVPVGACTHRITDGHYRHAAVKKINKSGADLLLPCIPVEPGDAVARMKRQIATAVEREGLTTMDIARAIRKLLDAQVPKQEIRTLFPRVAKGGKMQPASNSYVNMMVSFLDFPKDIQKKIHEGIIGVAGAYTLTRKPRDKWEEIVAEMEVERDKEIEWEEREEEKYLAQEKKDIESRQKAEKLAKELEAAKADLQEKAGLADTAVHAETEAMKVARQMNLDAEAKKAAEEKLKLAQENTKTVIRLAEDAKKLKAKLEEKLGVAEKNAEERKKKLADARKAANRAAEEKGGGKKGEKKAAGPAQVERAAAKVGASANVPPLTAASMRKAVDDWALPGSFPKIQAIFLIVKDCFMGGLTPDQAYAKMALVTGEKKAKGAAK